MSELVERPSAPRRDTQRTIRDYQDATGCSQLRATFHWASVCYTIVSQVARKQASISPETMIELVNFTLAYEAMEADLSGESDDRW